MKSEQNYLDRVEEPSFFRAPHDLFEPCTVCNLAIQPGEIIVQTQQGYAHEACITEN